MSRFSGVFVVFFVAFRSFFFWCFCSGVFVCFRGVFVCFRGVFVVFSWRFLRSSCFSGVFCGVFAAFLQRFRLCVFVAFFVSFSWRFRRVTFAWRFRAVFLVFFVVLL